MKINQFILKGQFRYFLLLLITIFIAFPFLKGVKSEIMLISCIFFTVIIFAFRLLAIRMRYIVSFLTSQVLIFLIGVLVWPHLSEITERNLAIVPLITYTVFLGYSLVLMISKIFETSRVTATLIAIGMSIYLLIGFLWTLFYYIIQYYDSNAFHYVELRNSMYLMYYSFTTLTTLGYGDIYPVNRFAMVFSNLEAIFGQIYISIFVARLVGMHIVHESNNSK